MSEYDLENSVRKRPRPIRAVESLNKEIAVNINQLNVSTLTRSPSRCRLLQDAGLCCFLLLAKANVFFLKYKPESDKMSVKKCSLLM